MNGLVVIAQGAGPTVDEIERATREVLSRPRYTGRDVADISNPVIRAIARFFEWLGDLFGGSVGQLGDIRNLPGGRGAFATVVLVGLVAMAVVVGLRMGRRRLADSQTGVPIDPETRLTAAQLEEAARRAADAGDHETAVRHLFVAGLLRLDERGRITYDASTVTAEVRHRLADDVFDGIANDFERITYGDAPATGDDVDAAGARWSHLLARSEP